MDLRTERTRKSIAHAYLELKKQKPIEKISVKELAELAYINKATFYIHYHDIYDLADQLENRFFDDILNEVVYVEQFVSNPAMSVQSLALALSKKKSISDVLFSGSRQGLYAQKLHQALRSTIDSCYPEKINDLQWNVVITIIIQGCYHAFEIYSTEENQEELTQLIGNINQFLCDKFL